MFIEKLESRQCFDGTIAVPPPVAASRPIGEWISNWLQGMGYGDFPNPKRPNPLWEGAKSTTQPTTQPSPTTQPAK